MRCTRVMCLLSTALFACGVPERTNTHSGPGADLAGSMMMNNGTDDGGNNNNGQTGCGELSGCYTVYAHSDHELYNVDLTNKMLVHIGNFAAPMNDTITDLAVAGDDSVYVISHTALYKVDKATAKVTLVGPLTSCGSAAIALTFTPDGNLYSADYNGAFCRIDLTKSPPAVISVGTLGGNLAITGDLVAVADGTMYGSAFTKGGSTTNDVLVTLDPKTGKATQTIGKTGFGKLFGVAYDNGQVYGFTHDGSGDVVTIDPKTGVGTLYNSFKDPTTNMPISFAGAGVNSMVPPMIM